MCGNAPPSTSIHGCRRRHSAVLKRGGAMTGRLKQASVAFIVVFVAAQLVRPERANPATDPGGTIQAHVRSTSGVAAVLDRSCGDCHSNKTVWRWYTQI